MSPIRRSGGVTWGEHAATRNAESVKMRDWKDKNVRAGVVGSDRGLQQSWIVRIDYAVFRFGSQHGQIDLQQARGAR